MDKARKIQFNHHKIPSYPIATPCQAAEGGFSGLQFPGHASDMAKLVDHLLLLVGNSHGRAYCMYIYILYIYIWLKYIKVYIYIYHLEGHDAILYFVTLHFISLHYIT